MEKKERAQVLRDEKGVHYNCCQAVLIPFATDCGLEEHVAADIAANFGSGMRHGATCGAITGALMVLGLKGKGGEETQRLLDAFQEKNGCLTCRELLSRMEAEGLERKPFCDGKVGDAVELLEEMLKD